MAQEQRAEFEIDDTFKGSVPKIEANCDVVGIPCAVAKSKPPRQIILVEKIFRGLGVLVRCSFQNVCFKK